MNTPPTEQTATLATAEESSLPRSLTERFSMQGKHVIVTGSANGLGLSIAEGLLEFGAHVTLLDINDVALAQAVETISYRAPTGAAAITTRRCDISNVDEVASVIADSASEQGPPDAVFANAGIAGGPGIDSDAGRLYDFDWADFDRALAINLRGTLATVRAAATAMRPTGRGSIIVTASTSGLRGETMVGYGYNSSKAAVVNMVRQAAIDLARDGIRVNGIAPGPIDGTKIGGDGPTPPAIDRMWSGTVPVARMGSMPEIQGLALLLASDASSFMTGGIYAVDGGAMAGWFQQSPSSDAG